MRAARTCGAFAAKIPDQNCWSDTLFTRRDCDIAFTCAGSQVVPILSLRPAALVYLSMVAFGMDAHVV